MRDYRITVYPADETGEPIDGSTSLLSEQLKLHEITSPSIALGLLKTFASIRRFSEPVVYYLAEEDGDDLSTIAEYLPKEN